MMSIAAIIVTVILVAAGSMSLYRVVRGPATLDRVVATDVLLAIAMASIAAGAAFTGDGSALAILVVLSILGFSSSVGVARFAAREERKSDS